MGCGDVSTTAAVVVVDGTAIVASGARAAGTAADGIGVVVFTVGVTVVVAAAGGATLPPDATLCGKRNYFEIVGRSVMNANDKPLKQLEHMLLVADELAGKQTV